MWSRQHNRPPRPRILLCASIFALSLSALTGADVPEHRPPRPSPSPPLPSIPITGFLGNEVSLLQSMLQIVPAAHWVGIAAVQSAVHQNDGVFDTLNVLSPGGILLYLPPPTNRPTDAFYPLLAYHFAEALGENVYNAVLTSAERNEWQSLTLPGFNPQQEFGQFYSLWTLYSNGLIQQALTNPPSSANPSLAQTIFVASLPIKGFWLLDCA